MEVSPSTVARIIEPLVQHGVVLFDRYEGGMKILALNQDSQKTKVLMNFNEALKAL